MQGSYTKAVLYPGICKVRIVPYSVSLKMSQGREREEIPCFPLQLKEIAVACPKETCSKGLAALKSVAKVTGFYELVLHIWCFSLWLLTSLTFCHALNRAHDCTSVASKLRSAVHGLMILFL